MGGTKVSTPPPAAVPAPTPEERQIQRLQLETMQKQLAQMDAAAPLIEKQNQLLASQLDATLADPSLAREQIALQRKQMELTQAQLDALVADDGSGSIVKQQVDLQRQALTLQQRQLDEMLKESAAGRDITQQQVDLQRQQLTLAQQAADLQSNLTPFVLQSMGLVQEPGGKVRKMTEDEFTATLDETGKAARENLILSLERQRRALKGELPLSEAGQQQKRDEFQTFKEAMARAGHVIEGDNPETAVATSTPGIQALKAFNERFGLLEEAERRGEITAGTQAVLAQQGLTSDIGASRRAGLLQFPGSSSALATSLSGLIPSVRTQGISIPNVGSLNIPSVHNDYGAVAGQFAGLLQPYQFQRGLEFSANQNYANQAFQANQYSAANRAALYGGLLQGAGYAGGRILGSKKFLG